MLDCWEGFGGVLFLRRALGFSFWFASAVCSLVLTESRAVAVGEFWNYDLDRSPPHHGCRDYVYLVFGGNDQEAVDKTSRTHLGTMVTLPPNKKHKITKTLVDQNKNVVVYFSWGTTVVGNLFLPLCGQ